jgi:hypothetical protein
MHRFYFNDCLPPCESKHTFIKCLSDTLIEFNKLTEENLAIEKAIVTEKLPSLLLLSDTLTLKESLDDIPDRELKRLAYKFFTQYPVDTYFPLESGTVDTILSKNYSLSIEAYNYDALNLAMVAEKKGFLFTVALHNEFKKDSLNIISQTDGSIANIDNLYGIEANTTVIRKKIENLNVALLSKIERLKHVLGDYILSSYFEKDFPKLTDIEQDSVIEHFERAKARNGITPFFADGDRGIIRDVTPNNSKCTVCELRIFSPTALRVFFNESNGKIYVSHIFFKSETDQNASIKKASQILNKLILTN